MGELSREELEPFDPLSIHFDDLYKPQIPPFLY